MQTKCSPDLEKHGVTTGAAFLGCTPWERRPRESSVVLAWRLGEAYSEGISSNQQDQKLILELAIRNFVGKLERSDSPFTMPMLFVPYVALRFTGYDGNPPVHNGSSTHPQRLSAFDTKNVGSAQKGAYGRCRIILMPLLPRRRLLRKPTGTGHEPRDRPRLAWLTDGELRHSHAKGHNVIHGCNAVNQMTYERTESTQRYSIHG